MPSVLGFENDMSCTAAANLSRQISSHYIVSRALGSTSQWYIGLGYTKPCLVWRSLNGLWCLTGSSTNIILVMAHAYLSRHHTTELACAIKILNRPPRITITNIHLVQVAHPHDRHLFSSLLMQSGDNYST